jgi:two-component system response regulator DegU
MDFTIDNKKIRLILADDHPMVRQGVKRALELEDRVSVVGEATDTDSVMAMVAQMKPDIVLLDINMPGQGGLWITRQLALQYPDVKVIVFTFHDEDEYIGDALRAGAKGYLLKEADGSQLVDAILSVHTGKSYIFPTLVDKVFKQLQRATQPSLKRYVAEREELSSRELEVLKLIVKGRSNKEIGQDLYISEKTVKNHISNILRKMSLEDRTQAAIAAVKQGLVDI